MSTPEIEKIFINTYGYVPKPTEREADYHELLVISDTFDREQLRSDILKLASVASENNDQLTEEIALLRWNTLFPKNQYRSVEMLIGVENSY